MSFHREGVLRVYRLSSSVHHNTWRAVKATILASGLTLVCGSATLPSDHRIFYDQFIHGRSRGSSHRDIFILRRRWYQTWGKEEFQDMKTSHMHIIQWHLVKCEVTYSYTKDQQSSRSAAAQPATSSL